MRVISVVGLKGGSGKTSTAVPLALEASREGRTVLIDMDETPSASQWIRAAGLEGESLRVERVGTRAINARANELEDEGQTDWVIVDTPPVAQDVVMLAAGVADLVVIPVHIGSGDIAQVVQTRTLLDLPLRANPELQIRAILNHAGMTAVTRETRAALEGEGLTVAEREIPYRKAYVVAKGSAPTADWWHFTELWQELRGLL